MFKIMAVSLVFGNIVFAGLFPLEPCKVTFLLLKYGVAIMQLELKLMNVGLQF